MKKPKLEIDIYGTRRWYLNGDRHRTDGPAVENADGTKWWYMNGKRHRTDGPAIEHVNGHRVWFVNGKRHRTNGPAVVWTDGRKYWFLNDTQYSFAKWLELTPVSEHQKLLLAIEYSEHV